MRPHDHDSTHFWLRLAFNSGDHSAWTLGFGGLVLSFAAFQRHLSFWVLNGTTTIWLMLGFMGVLCMAILDVVYLG